MGFWFHNKLISRGILIVILIAALITVGCSATGKPTDKDDSPGEANTDLSKKQDYISLAAYYVKYTKDDAYLVREVHTVPYTKQVAKAALNELINDEKSILPQGTEILDINIDKGLATVNFNSRVLEANVGSHGEGLGIQSIVNTLTEFPTVEKVSFQVEGRSDGRARDWWGHVGLYEQPFKRNLSEIREPAIWVTHPTPEQVVGVPLLIKGSAMVFEGAVNARLLDQNGQTIAEGHTTASAGAPERGEFEMSLKFDPPPNGMGNLEVFWTSPKDGSIIDKVEIPVKWP